MLTHSSILAWRIPWMEKPGGLQSMGSQRVGHDSATSFHFTSLHDLIKHQWHCGFLTFCSRTFLLPSYRCQNEPIPFLIYLKTWTCLLNQHPLGQWTMELHCVSRVDASDSCMFLRKPSKIKFPLPTGVTLIHHADNSFTSCSVFTLFRFSLYLSWFTYQINYLFKHPCIRLCFYDNPSENEWVDLRWSKEEGEKIA